jgi:hypothetical protein
MGTQQVIDGKQLKPIAFGDALGDGRGGAGHPVPGRGQKGLAI